MSLDGKQGSMMYLKMSQGRKPCPPEAGETKGRDGAPGSQCDLESGRTVQ